jgi:hypothetical protein
MRMYNINDSCLGGSLGKRGSTEAGKDWLGSCIWLIVLWCIGIIDSWHCQTERPVASVSDNSSCCGTHLYFGVLQRERVVGQHLG